MKRLLVFLMMLFAVSATVFAANYEKDCKLDLNRWLMLEEYPAGKYVRLFDSLKVYSLGSNRFEATLCDFYYSGHCKGQTCDSMNVNGTKHYHVRKLEFDMDHKKMFLKAVAILDKDGKELISREVPNDKKLPVTFDSNSDREYIMMRIKGYAKKENNHVSNQILQQPIYNEGTFRKPGITKDDFVIGGIYIGQPLDEAISKYGQPVYKDYSFDSKGNKYPRYYFVKNGFVEWFLVDTMPDETQSVITVSVNGNLPIATKAGIKIGSSSAEVRKIYGEPSECLDPNNEHVSLDDINYKGSCTANYIVDGMRLQFVLAGNGGQGRKVTSMGMGIKR